MNYEQLVDEIFEYYGKESSSFAKNIWIDYVKKNLTLEEFKKASYLIIAEEKFLPTPKLIVEKIKGNPKILAKEQWLAVIACNGSYKKLPKKTREIIKKLGHIHLMDHNQQFQARLDFIEMYEAYKPQKQSETKKLQEVKSEEPLPPINYKALAMVNDFCNNF